MDIKRRFDINPHVIKQLGAELVTDEVIALMEIVKNSYDADASYVSISIDTINQYEYEGEDLFYPNHKGYIIVEDDGFGMDQNTILKSWLTISYSNKRGINGVKPKTPKGRTPLGDKGLGRLSTQKLANICEIFTQKNNTIESIHMGFNWSEFDNYDTLGEVPVHYSLSTQNRQGTKIVLLDLKYPDVWKGANLEKFKGKISQMISPYAENRPFEVYIQINGESIDLDKENEQLKDFDLSRYSFSFNENGKIEINGSIKIEKLIGNSRDNFNTYILPDSGKKFIEFLKKKDKYPKGLRFERFVEFNRIIDFYTDIDRLALLDGAKANPGIFKGEIYEYSYDNWLSHDERIKSIFDGLSNYREFAQSQSGIKLYRNGFAIKPYGLDGDDWLKLGEGQTSGSSFYGLRPKNVIGYIAIDELENSNLKDKTDREGLISNEYYTNFYRITQAIINEISKYNEFVRRGYNDFLTLYKTENSKIKTVSQAFSQLKSTSEASMQIKTDFNIDAVKRDVKEAISKTERFIKSGENSALFSTEEEKKAINQLKEINEELKKAELILQKVSPVLSKTEELQDVINIIEPKIEILEEQLENFSQLASVGLVAETVSHEFATIADKLSEKSTIYASKLENGKLTDSDSYILVEYINSTVNGLKTQLKHIDPSLRYNRERKDIIGLQSFFLEEEADYYKEILSKNDIQFNVISQNNFSIKTNKGKFTQIVDNIINNSEYWLKEKKSTEPDFNPEIKIEIDKPWIYIHDNGFGISPDISNFIFEPFVSTKPMKGRGLGLFIVQQLLDSMNCSIILEPTLNQYERQYIFSINLANIIE